MKKIKGVVSISIVMMMIMSSVVSMKAEETKSYIWVLKETEHVQASDKNSDYYEYSTTVSNGTINKVQTYIGNSQESYDPPLLNGESGGQILSWTPPKAQYLVGDEINIDASLQGIINKVSYTDFVSNGARFQIRIGNGGATNLNGISKNSETTNYTGTLAIVLNEYESDSGSFYTTAPSIYAEGDTMMLQVSIGKSSAQVRYHYEAVEAGSEMSEAVTVGETEEEEIEVESEPVEEEEEECQNCIGWDSKCQPLRDSGIRFSDISGRVQVCPCIDYLDEAWESAGLDMVLNVNDYIKTGSGDSYAILSLTDMTTFIQKPETTIILSNPPMPESKISLVKGIIWTNLKKMVKDGSMELNMSQAAAGIKGTILVCEETGTESTLKVLEGSVEFTSYATGEAVMVSAGEKVTADSKGLSEVVEFDIAEEAMTWPEEYVPEELLGTEEVIEESIDEVAEVEEIAEVEMVDSVEKENEDSSNMMLYALIVIGVALSGIAIALFMILKKMKKD